MNILKQRVIKGILWALSGALIVTGGVILPASFFSTIYSNDYAGLALAQCFNGFCLRPPPNPVPPVPVPLPYQGYTVQLTVGPQDMPTGILEGLAKQAELEQIKQALTRQGITVKDPVLGGEETKLTVTDNQGNTFTHQGKDAAEQASQQLSNGNYQPPTDQQQGGTFDTGAGSDTASDKDCPVFPVGPSTEYGEFCGSEAVSVVEQPTVDCMSRPLPRYEEDVPANQMLRQKGYKPALSSPDKELASRTTHGWTYSENQKTISVEEEWNAANPDVPYQLPSREKALEFISTGFRGYTPEGSSVQMSPGMYHPGQAREDINGQKVKVTRDCKFVPGEGGEQGLQGQGGQQGGQQGQQGFGGGDFGGGGGGGQGGGLLDALLPLLGQLLGQQGQQGGQGQQGQQGGQGQRDQQQQQQQYVCPQVYEPVCGVDGRTYPNECVAKYQYQVQVAHSGECLEGETAVFGDLIKQAILSGVPEPLINNVIRVVVSLVISFFQGGTTMGETVVE